VARLTDLGRGRDIALGPAGLGAMLHEVPLDAGRGRAAIFGAGDGINDWSRPETIIWPPVQTGFRRAPAAEVAIGAPRLTALGPEIDAHLSWPHGDRATLTWRLPLAGPGIDLCATVEKTRVTTPESVFVVFALGGGGAGVDLDIGDLTVDAEEVLPEACRTWGAIQSHATLRTDAGALVVASPDAPLVHPFGPQTEAAGGRLLADAALGFWVMNNHWDVNFAAGQGGVVPFRFHLLPMAGPDRAAATTFARVATTPPVIVRTGEVPERAAAPLVVLEAQEPLDLRLRPFGGTAIMASVVNRGEREAAFSLRLPEGLARGVVAVAATGEETGDEVRLAGGRIEGRVAGRGVLRLRIDR
jgi:hypothetical protein